ncbi:MAG: cobalamin biosynthesis protein [Leptolyngbya sp. Prado105]|jgi:cobalt-precorrin 5A hydrolase/precorrin-3B C17-methyltransferase|nr:cobalamin biosynthesis protein [Leptolyngbya sp. Prado105]
MSKSKIWIGIGCRRGIAKVTIQSAIAHVLNEYQLTDRAIVGIATVDRKFDEPGLVEYCQERSLPLSCFSANRLKFIAVPHPSTWVAQTIETPSVAEAAAMCAAETETLKVPKQVIQGVTIAIAESSLS